MKDEIKEILYKLKSLDYDEYNLEFSVDYIERKEEKLLLDCITNLQEDNVELRNEVKELERMCELYGKSIYNAELTNLQEENERLSVELNKNMIERNNYLSRNEKAIEYVEHHKFNKFGDIDCGEAEEIINILNGGDDNE